MGFEDVIGVRKKDYSSSKKDHVNTVNDSVFNKKKKLGISNIAM